MEFISNKSNILSLNLLTQLVMTDINNSPLTSKPQITFFCQTRKSLVQKSHTNFASGIIEIIGTKSIETDISSNLVNPTYSYNLKEIPVDILEQAIIIVDSIDSIEYICLELNDQKINLTPDYIKVYSTVCSKLIFTNSCISIPLNLHDFIVFDKIMDIERCTQYLPICNSDIKTAKISIKSKTSPKLKIKCSVVDSDERRKLFLLNYFNCKTRSQNLQLVPDTESMYVVKTHCNTVTVGIKLPDGLDLDKLESIEIHTNKNKIVLTPNILKLYDQTQEQIIFGNMIKIKVYVGYYLTVGEFKIKINLNSQEQDVQVYSCINILDYDRKFIVSLNEKYTSFFQEHVFDKYNQIQIIEQSQYHLTQLFVFDPLKDTNSILNVNLQNINKTNVTGSVGLVESVIYSNVTDACDSVIYQQSLYKKVFPKYFTIGYSLESSVLQPSGGLNIVAGSKLNLIPIDPSAKSNDQIHVIVCGYKYEI